MVTVLPSVIPEPSSYGLLNSKTLVDEPLRWISGFEQESITCRADVVLLDACNAGATAQVIEKSGSGSLGPYTPFTVKSTVTCSVMGGFQRNWEDEALAALALAEQKSIEMEFWEGRLTRAAHADDPDAPLNQYLTNGSAVDLTPAADTPIKVRYGLALLEGALADAGSGGRGFIHTSRSIGSVLPVHDRDHEGILRTTLGNYVIAGDGYTGTGTNGAETTGSSQWIYATGPVYVRLSDSTVVANYPRQTINTSTNDIAVSADRTAAVVWDGCAHFKVLVDLSLDYA